MSQHDSPRPPRFCPNCGAHNLSLAATCTVCGQSLGKKEDFAKLWGAQSQTGPSEAQPEVIDLYPTYDASSSQATTPFTQTRPYDPTDFRPPDPAAGKKKTGPTGSPAKSALPVMPPPVVAATPARRSGPPGCVLGCLAMVLIGLVAAALGWGVVRAALSDRVEEEIANGVTLELQQIEQLPIDTSGQIVLSEDEINRSLEENASLYTPVEDVVVTLDRDEVRVRFRIFGLTSTFQGGLDVQDGVVRVTDPELSGAANRVIDAGEIARIFEQETSRLLSRFGYEPVDVLLREGSMVISTKPAGSELEQADVSSGGRV